MSSGIKCRKCGGNHLTIKCNKDKPEEVINKEEGGNKQNDNIGGNKQNDNIVRKTQNNEGERKPYNKQNNDGERKPYNKQNNDGERKTYNNCVSGKVKISSLPSDITKEELQELLYDWGHVKYINIKNYQDDTVAYIEFRDEEQANYLIEALDGTPFEFRMLKLSRIE